MKKTGKRLAAVLIAFAVIMGSTIGCFAAKKTEDAGKLLNASVINPEESKEIKDASEETHMESLPTEIKEEIKTDDEVVYVFTDATGKVNKVMDSIWISNDEDKTQTEKDANLPLKVDVKYSLDGKNVNPDELKGKSGHLKVDVLFTNNRYEMKNINGKEEKIYVPFLAGAVTALDGEKCSNVTVSNGRVIFDGARYAVVGVSLPGLKEDLELKDDTVNIPESISFEADVKDFDELGMYLLISNSVFSNLDIDTSEKMDTLKEDLNKIDDAMEALINGSDELYKGLTKLSEGAGTLSAGVNELSEGLKRIDANSDALTNGARTVFVTLLNTASAELNASGINVGTLTIDNYAATLNDVLSSGYTQKAAYATVESKVKANEGTIRNAVTEAVGANVLEKVTEAVKAEVTNKVTEAVKAAVTEKVTAAVKENVQAGVAAKVAEAYGITAEMALENQETLAAINANTETQMQTDDIKAMINSKVEEQMASETVKATIEAKTNEQMATEEVKAIIESTKAGKLESEEVKAIIDSKTLETVNSKIAEYEASDEVKGKISEGEKKIADLKASLDNYNAFYQGIIAYTNGVGQANAGAKKLNDSMPELTKGIDALRDGEKKLSNGLNQFNEEGIVKLNDLVNNTLEGMVERFNTVKEVSGDYASYGTKGEAAKDGVRFIYKISSSK